jgi:phosphomannomutase
MAAEGALFGGEVTGHYSFAGFNYADSGSTPALLILEMLSKSEPKMVDLLRPLAAAYFISGEINSTVADGNAKMAALAERYGDGVIERLDGISISYPIWHFNVRGLSTEPLLRLNLASIASRAEMEQRRDEVLAIIRG